MTPDDAGRWAAPLVAAEAVDRTGEHCDEADCAVSLTDPDVDLARDSVRDLYVATVGTVPDRRGRGVAAALLTHALERARDGGYDSSSLHVDAQNPTGALGVYRRAGYLPVARQVTYALPAPS
jgi:ribosomal protein S18 acetylase RimI-like enzyme